MSTWHHERADEDLRLRRAALRRAREAIWAAMLFGFSCGVLAMLAIEAAS